MFKSFLIHKLRFQYFILWPKYIEFSSKRIISLPNVSFGSKKKSKYIFRGEGAILSVGGTSPTPYKLLTLPRYVRSFTVKDNNVNPARSL